MADRQVAPRPLASTYDVLLLDLDGVVYRGDQAVPRAVEALGAAERLGVRRVFVTNNASRTPANVADQLVELGIPTTARDVVTSAQAAAGLLATRLPGGAKVLVIGGDGLLQAVTERGLRPVATADEHPIAIVQGFSPGTTWQMLMEACVGVRAGLPWIVTNADATLPTPRGDGPGNGALVDVVRAVTGVEPDEVAGKPHPPIMDEARRRRQATRPLVVGDRLDTDIEAAVAADVDSLLVLTGVTGVLQLLGCPPGRRPTYVAPDLDGLLRAGHRPGERGGWWVCGEVAVRLDDQGGRTRVEVSSEGAARTDAGATPLEPDGRSTTAAAVVHAAAAALWSTNLGAEAVTGVREALTSWAAPFGWDR